VTIEPNRPRVDEFWRAYRAAQPGLTAEQPDDVWYFGDTPEMADELSALVRAGVKTATSGLIWEMEADGDRPAHVGEVAVVVDGRGEPVCVIEVTEVAERPFDGVDEQFVYDYGEGSRTPAFWHQEMWAYYVEVCARLGRAPSPDMPLSCQRFRRLYPTPK
jgi:uncharacterized protein YhfF